MIPNTTAKPLIINEQGNTQVLPDNVGLDIVLKTEDILVSSSKKTIVIVGQRKVIEEYAVTEFRVFHWLVSVLDQTTAKFYTCFILAQHDGVEVTYVEFATVGDKSIDFDILIENGYVKLCVNAITNNQTVTVLSQAIRIS
jgi:hypothetical protein